MPANTNTHPQLAVTARQRRPLGFGLRVCEWPAILGFGIYLGFGILGFGISPPSHLLAATASAAPAPAPVTLTIPDLPPGRAIPADFAGLSFGAMAVVKNNGDVPGYLFTAANTQVITIFKNAALRHLRMGGTSVEGPKASVPDHETIDNIFAFARAADITVTYTLRLLDGDPATAASDAAYIWQNHRDHLDYFALGNEPDEKSYADASIKSKDYPTYLATWRRFAAAVTAAVPDAKFAGPDTAGGPWAVRFAADMKTTPNIALITTHTYIGGAPFLDKKERTTRLPPSQAIENMLSRDWPEKKYPAMLKTTIAPIIKTGRPWRLTEVNDVTKGVPGASNAYASALWALDYLHWWALRSPECAGMNFHNTKWLATGTIYRDPADGAFKPNPKAYATRAFALGSQGRVQPLTLSNPDHLNLTAYAVTAADATLYLTIINKEHGPNARPATVSIDAAKFPTGTLKTMSLISATNDPAALTGITLGGDTITNSTPWRGKWSDPVNYSRGQCTVPVPATSALIVIIYGRWNPFMTPV